ncbi:hypothetical protein ACIFOC_00665 [Leucobacter aridicollis]|uniref:hypothetical protein n=1 Tax=Leucobacter aridicollis TaxID=283878 RepID=UPI0037CBC70E
MPRNARKALVPITAIAAAVALTLSGCSAKPGDKAAEIDEGPLSKYLSALWDGEEMTEEAMQEEQLKVEELVAACMQKEGFEYEPDTQSMTFFAGDEEEMDGPQWGSKEFAEQYGYGFFDSPWNNQPEEEGNEYVDPNQEYVESLSESEQQAFYEVLYGPRPTEEQMAEMEEGGGYTSDWTQEGCQGAARHEISQEAQGAQAAYEDPEFADLFEAMNEVWGMEPSEEMTALNTEWAACMADSGYGQFSTPDDAQNSIMEASNELYGGGEYVEGEEPKEPSKEKMDELKKLEIETAVADFECKDKVGYEKKSTKIMHAQEQKFVDEHKAELDAMLAKYQTKSGSKSEEK